MRVYPLKREDLIRPVNEDYLLHGKAGTSHQQIMSSKTPIVSEDLPDINAISKWIPILPKDPIQQRQLLKRNETINATRPKRKFNYVNLVDKPKKRGKKWRDNELQTLLDKVKDVKPCSYGQWELVAAQLYESGFKNDRDGGSCKLKFERLWQTKTPTGTTEMQVLIARAKDIKQIISPLKITKNKGLKTKKQISDAEMHIFIDRAKDIKQLIDKKRGIRNVGFNNIYGEDDTKSISDGGNPSDVIHFCDETKKINTLSKRNRKVPNTTEAILSLGSEMKKASHKMDSAIIKPRRQNDEITNLFNRVSALELKMNSFDKKMHKMHTILEFIKNKI